MTFMIVRGFLWVPKNLPTFKIEIFEPKISTSIVTWRFLDNFYVSNKSFCLFSKYFWQIWFVKWFFWVIFPKNFTELSHIKKLPFSEFTSKNRTFLRNRIILDSYRGYFIAGCLMRIVSMLNYFRSCITQP